MPVLMSVLMHGTSVPRVVKSTRESRSSRPLKRGGVVVPLSVDRVLLPEFTELEGALQVYLHEVTLRVIREEIYDDASDAQEVPDAVPSN
ncbi:hypothetical protein WDM22_44415 (plasmid) [Bradyrhizobium septentrionale]|uniref:hypothetical protein n=1 Tax=Bradyrhizobium septentrionale TaxID=1404411 RepID=UPI0030CB6685